MRRVSWRVTHLVQVAACFALLGIWADGGAAGEPKVLGWPDLVPKQATFEDPFAELTRDQLYELSMVAAYRMRAAAGDPLTAKGREELAGFMSSLASQGVDIDGLLAQREEITQKRQAAAEAVDPSLDSQNVRIPGFLLPPEFDGTRVTEFLLVPTVGACIHVPPPPPNQMVHVSIADGFESDGLYTPVWVEGTMSVEGGESELFLQDGTAGIAFGYRLDATKVSAYE